MDCETLSCFNCRFPYVTSSQAPMCEFSNKLFFPLENSVSCSFGTHVLLVVQPERAHSLSGEECELKVRSWSDDELSAHTSRELPEKLQLRDMLFFLHVPRTGGRTYNLCLLKNLFSVEERCPRSYDKFRFDISKPTCRLVSTHDDYSLLKKLPIDMTSVVTNLRHPVDRVLSSYEFSIEVAARFLRQPKNVTASRTTVKRAARPGDDRFISTLQVWPWKYLVPWMRGDLFQRRDARINGPRSDVVFNNSYEAASLVMPLEEFIHHPEAFELVHNGATLQIAGLTNNSFVEEAKDVRECIWTYEHLGQIVLSVAKRRLDDMLFVGVTEHHQETASIFAHVVGDQVSAKTVLNNGGLNDGVSQQPANGTDRSLRAEESNQTQVLVHLYNNCVDGLRSSQAKRRSLSLELISPIVFSPEERSQIPDRILSKIRRLNHLDEELYDYAKVLFEKQKGLTSLSFKKKSHQNQPSLSWSTLQHATNLWMFLVWLLVTSLGIGVIYHLQCHGRRATKRSAFHWHHPLFLKAHEKV